MIPVAAALELFAQGATLAVGIWLLWKQRQ